GSAAYRLRGAFPWAELWWRGETACPGRRRVKPLCALCAEERKKEISRAQWACVSGRSRKRILKIKHFRMDSSRHSGGLSIKVDTVVRRKAHRSHKTMVSWGVTGDA